MGHKLVGFSQELAWHGCCQIERGEAVRSFYRRWESDLIEEESMVQKAAKHSPPDERGVSIMEIIIVLAMISVLTAAAVPQIISQRRLVRSSAVVREVSTQMRLARQLAMSQRRAFTFQYDDTTKSLKVIGPIDPGTVALADPGYPNNTGSSTIVDFPLTQGGLSASEIVYGIPTTADLPSGAPTIPTTALADGASKTNLNSSSKLNITFQPDGSVIDSGGGLVNRALFIFNGRAAQATASAVSVLGASGRVKSWRYTTNGNRYAD
jgi:Tfp pilus assembly protein FimT